MAGFAGAARAEDVMLEPIHINDAKSCREVLTDFAWTCDEFDRPHWREFIEAMDGESKSFWEKYDASAAIRDLDLDGRDDLILRVRSALTCGINECESYIFFADIPSSGTRKAVSIRNGGHLIYYRVSSGRPEIRFEDANWLDVNDLKKHLQPAILFK